MGGRFDFDDLADLELAFGGLAALGSTGDGCCTHNRLSG